ARFAPGLDERSSCGGAAYWFGNSRRSGTPGSYFGDDDIEPAPRLHRLQGAQGLHHGRRCSCRRSARTVTRRRPMRVTWKSGAGISLLFAGAAFGHPALAADCGPLPVLTRLDLNPRAGVPIVPAMIGDKPVNLLVDTGGAFSVLTKRTIREFGLPTSTSRVELRNTNGQRENLAVRLPSITLGLIRQEGVFFMVDPRED